MLAGDTPLICGHRGVAAEAPENSMAGFRLAARQGVRAVEFDARLSRDGVPVVVHDATLDRTTNATGRVSDHTAAALAALDVGDGSGIQTLDQVLALALALDLQVNIEIKGDGEADPAQTARQSLAVARARWPADRPPPLISSFFPEIVGIAGEWVPDWPRSLILQRPHPDAPALARSLGATGLGHHDRFVNRAEVERALAAGLAVGVYTVNHPPKARLLADWGVGLIISDRPAAIAAAFA